MSDEKAERGELLRTSQRAKRAGDSAGDGAGDSAGGLGNGLGTGVGSAGVRSGDLLAGQSIGEATEVSEESANETVQEPAKVMRIGAMIKGLLDEVRQMQLDVPSRERLAEIYERSIVELAEAISPDLREELHTLALPFREGEVPSDAELRIAKAQLVGWLEGLFHGIQATLFAQQLAARQQLEQMRQLPASGNSQVERPGTYI